MQRIVVPPHVQVGDAAPGALSGLNASGDAADGTLRERGHSLPDPFLGAMPEDPAASRLGGRPAQAAEALGLASEDIGVDVTSAGRDKRPAVATIPAST